MLRFKITPLIGCEGKEHDDDDEVVTIDLDYTDSLTHSPSVMILPENDVTEPITCECLVIRLKDEQIVQVNGLSHKLRFHEHRQIQTSSCSHSTQGRIREFGWEEHFMLHSPFCLAPSHLPF